MKIAPAEIMEVLFHDPNHARVVKRIHRITAPSRVVWGENDRLIAPVYAEEFGKAWPHSAVFMLPRCGHEPPLEQMEMPRDKVTGFLAAAAI